MTGWSNTSQPLSRHILTIDILKFMFTVSRIYFNPYLHCWVAIIIIIIIIIKHLYSAIMSYADTEALVAPVKSE